MAMCEKCWNDAYREAFGSGRSQTEVYLELLEERKDNPCPSKMNHKYKKKPVVIEAFQMTKERRWDNSDWPEWLHEAWNKPYFGEGSVGINPDDPMRERLVCGTLEGVHRINWDDWIIQGVKGEIYVCKPDIFEATYDPVE